MAKAKRRHPRRTPRKQDDSVKRAVVYAISDSTGNLARHMLNAFLTQFPTGAFAVRVEQFVRTESHLNEVLEKANRETAIICHAVVSAALKKTIISYCVKAGIPFMDLTGPAVDFLSLHTGVAPRDNLDALHRLDQTYDRRIAALEYALTHDDGLGLETLHEADIVLTGVSRTSKTPTSIYLAQQGYRVANVSLALGVEPPAQLLALPPKKAVGLVIGAQQLVLIRCRRQDEWRSARTRYDDPDHVERELTWTRRLFSQRGWPVIDVTDQAIEETAARAVNSLGLAHA